MVEFPARWHVCYQWLVGWHDLYVHLERILALLTRITTTKITHRERLAAQPAKIALSISRLRGESRTLSVLLMNPLAFPPNDPPAGLTDLTRWRTSGLLSGRTWLAGDHFCLQLGVRSRFRRRAVQEGCRPGCNAASHNLTFPLSGLTLVRSRYLGQICMRPGSRGLFK